MSCNALSIFPIFISNVILIFFLASISCHRSVFLISMHSCMNDKDNRSAQILEALTPPWMAAIHYEQIVNHVPCQMTTCSCPSTDGSPLCSHAILLMIFLQTTILVNHPESFLCLLLPLLQLIFPVISAPLFYHYITNELLSYANVITNVCLMFIIALNVLPSLIYSKRSLLTLAVHDVLIILSGSIPQQPPWFVRSCESLRQ